MEEREYFRLKELIESGRKFHYRNFIFCGLLLVLLLKDAEDNLSIFLNIEFPVKDLILFLYLVILIYTSIGIDILTAVWEKSQKDFIGEIPFNWFILSQNTPFNLALFWITFPLILSIVTIGFSDFGDNTLMLTFFGLIALQLPLSLKRYSSRILSKEDENGNKITLSIYFSYWYRLIEPILFIILLGLLLTNIFKYSPTSDIKDSEKVEITYRIITVFIVSFSIFFMRIICDSQFIYQLVDKMGTK